MANILIVGKILSENIDHIKSFGHKIFLLKDKYIPENDIKALEEYHGVFEVDITSEESILHSLRNQDIPKSDGVLAMYERYIYAKSVIGNYYGLRVPSIAAAKAVTDKQIQRSLYNQYDKSISPNFRLVESENDIKDFINEYGTPVILKPTNLLKSLFVKKCTTTKEAIDYYDENKYKLIEVYKEEQMYGREPKFIIEEFLDGSGHSIEVFMDEAGTVHLSTDVVDVLKAKDIGIDDNYEYCRILPSRLSEDIKNKVKEVAAKGMRALNLKNSPGHVEIMVTEDGPKIIEINGRLGGYRDRMFLYTYGISLLDKELDLILGNQISFNPVKAGYTAVFELFPDEKGLFDYIENEEELKRLHSLKYFTSTGKKGEKVGLAKHGYRCLAIVILSNNNKEEFESDFNFIKNKVKIQVLQK